MRQDVNVKAAGADPEGGGVMGVRTPPLFGDPKTSKRGENVERVHANVARFSTNKLLRHL